MLQSYFLVAVRNLIKRKGYSAINILGLSVGLAAVVIILLYCRHELNYDRFHANGDRIFQVYKERITPTGVQVTRDTWVPLAERLEHEFPAVEKAVRMWDDQVWVRHGDTRFEEPVTYADPGVLEIFSFPLQHGDAASALSGPNGAVVSQEFATRYFGDADPIGRSIRVDNAVDYTVMGVLAEIPPNSTFDYDLLLPLTSLPWYGDVVDEWGGSFLYTYILLDEAAGAAELEEGFPSLIERIWDEETASRTNFKLEPLYELYDALTGNRQYAYILLGVALIILVIAVINFMNLATARSLERAREIGMRKVLGAHRRQLVLQFMGEATLLSLLSLVLALLIVGLTLPVFNDLYGMELSLRVGEGPLFFMLFVALGLVVGLLAGAYPALHVSKYRTARVLRGVVTSSAEGAGLRNGLVIAQFTLAVGLIALTLVMRNQLTYLQTAELKFDSQNVVVVEVESGDIEDQDTASGRLVSFKNELRRSSDVISVSASSHTPGRWSGWFTFAFPEGWGDQDPLRVRRAFVDEEYFEAYDIPLVEGRAFDSKRATDADESVIINEAARRSFGWESALGRTVRSGDSDYQIVGVVQDYHFDALRTEIAPVLHFYRASDNAVHNFIAVRFRPGSERSVLSTLEDAWARVDPRRDLPYEFADRTFAQLYEQESRLISVTGTFTMLAILIACLGLLALASWSVTQRVREVGIRKVLGASATNIVLLLSGHFLRLVGLALVIALPLAYIAAGRWLHNFAYRIDPEPAAFLIAAASALLLAFLTVSSLGLRAALADPVDSLRSE